MRVLILSNNNALFFGAIKKKSFKSKDLYAAQYTLFYLMENIISNAIAIIQLIYNNILYTVKYWRFCNL